MTTHHITTRQQVAPFMTPGNAFAFLFRTATARMGHWLRTRREQRRQRRNMRQLRALNDRMLRDIGVGRVAMLV